MPLWLWPLVMVFVVGSVVRIQPSDDPPTIAPDRLETRLHILVNEARARLGRAPLRWSEPLARIGRAHSADMAARDFFAHTNPDGETFDDRFQRHGFTCHNPDLQGAAVGVMGENLYFSPPYRSIRVVRRGLRMTRAYDWKTLEDVARDAVQGWLDSPGHRRNLLNPDHAAQGIGVVVSEKGIYVSQELC
jgi:uncharacterized protein YkwD